MKKKKRKHTNKKHLTKSVYLSSYDQDDTFYMLIDFTEGGFPFGITWEEYYDNILDYKPDYFYISEISGDKILGLTWKEYLKELDKQFLTYE
ncbi:hypothetical protein [Paenibacillus koleovorans]|uniref:hypothetical protein n=1 Tax=Paenibacillus koleovorans TaxID=121608 RepID=UPI000FD7267D|nr:hypothetical protein [Paenibacillus koleovorans]